MYDRFLFIGLGGSGGSTLGYLKEEISQWLVQSGQSPTIPEGWQFLHIDTPTNSDANPRVDEDEYLGLIHTGVQFRDVQTMLDGNENLYDDIQTWRVDPGALPIPLHMGAGQFRAIGQTVAIAYAREIRNRIDRSIQRLKKAETTAELKLVYREATKDNSDRDSKLHIVVVSSLAGGSGAGLLQVVCDEVRAMNTAAGEAVFGILYTPEVFSTLPDDQKKGVQPNSLGALCELLNGYWWNGSAALDSNEGVVAPKVSAALLQAGLPTAIMRSGPSFPFLVGSEGAGGISVGRPDDIYAMVGRSLLSWTTDVVVQEKFLAYNITNWYQSAMGHHTGKGTLVNEGDLDEIGWPPFSALGFSRLSTGSDHFAKYAARRLARDALDHVARFHVGSQEAQAIVAKHNQADPDVVSDMIADVHLNGFMTRCELSELGPHENDIIDALRPVVADGEALSEFERTTVQLSGIGDSDAPDARTEEWKADLRNAIESGLPAYKAAYTRALGDTTIDWIDRAQLQISGVAREMVALYGLKVTKSLCMKAASRLKLEVAEELRTDDYFRNNQFSNDWEDWSSRHLEGVGGSRLGSDDERLRKARDRAVEVAALAGEAMLALRAADLAEEVADKVLVPLAKALDSALYQAEKGAEEAGQWPAWLEADPPPDTVPRPGEFPLISPDTYHDLFEDMLAATMAGDKSGTVRQQVRMQVISGDFFDNEGDGDNPANAQSLIELSNDWWPSASTTEDILRPATELTATVHSSLEDLEDRAKAWLLRPGSPFGDFLKLSLRSYLGETSLMAAGQTSEQEYDTRCAIFMAQMSAALGSAEPLVQIDAGLMGLVHPGPVGESLRSMSQVPFQGHPIEEQTKTNLRVAGMGDDDVEALFTADDSVKHIDITSTLAAPHSPLVIESLLRPISEAWAPSVAMGHGQTFWAMRRAQPISNFTPAPQALVHCMVRGWYTGVMLGLIDRAGEGDRPVTIARSGNTPVEFPFPYLSVGYGIADRLAQVLEGLGLAYVKVSELGHLEPLEAYCELRDLGRSDPGAELYGYNTLSPALRSWINTGETEDAIVEPFLEAAETPTDRARGLLDFVSNFKESLEEQMSRARRRWQNHASALSGPPLWTGLYRISDRQLYNLEVAVRRYREDAGGTEQFG